VAGYHRLDSGYFGSPRCGFMPLSAAGFLLVEMLGRFVFAFLPTGPTTSDRHPMQVRGYVTQGAPVGELGELSRENLTLAECKF
jgi:hypothetical protein